MHMPCELVLKIIVALMCSRAPEFSSMARVRGSTPMHCSNGYMRTDRGMPMHAPAGTEHTHTPMRLLAQFHALRRRHLLSLLECAV